MDNDPAYQAWAWFEAMDRAAMLNRYVADALLNSPAITSDPELKTEVENVINRLAGIYDECAAKMNECSAKSPQK